jgi:hypothetical protein
MLWKQVLYQQMFLTAPVIKTGCHEARLAFFEGIFPPQLILGLGNLWEVPMEGSHIIHTWKSVDPTLSQMPVRLSALRTGRPPLHRFFFSFSVSSTHFCCRSQCPRGLRHELSSPAPTLRSGVRIPLRHGFLCLRLFCIYPGWKRVRILPP